MDILKKGVFVMFCAEESIAREILKENKEAIYINFASKDSFKVPAYFKKKKLSIEESPLTSKSGMPNMLYASVCNLLFETDCVIVNTIGLSKLSVTEIIKGILPRMGSFKQCIFMHTSYIGKDYDYSLLKIDAVNIDMLEELL